MKNTRMKRAAYLGSAVALLSISGTALAADGLQIIKKNCLSCHTETGNSDTPFSRISEQRKTPEGWMTTLYRMKTQRGLNISPEEEQILIKYLSDTQGLAPSETLAQRYILERTPNKVEEVDPAYAEMCTRCHSGARFGMQRRTQGEWEKLVHFHMGQYPTIEYHALARDRAWFDIALNDVAPKLAADYPFKAQAWDDWAAKPKSDLTGNWMMSGYLPEKGDFSAQLSVIKEADDRYVLLVNGTYADGSKLNGSGSAKVFTGYEWRASLIIDGQALKQVLATDEQGVRMSGRMFVKGADEIGGAITAVKAGNSPAIAAVSPTYVKQGSTQTLVITGANLDQPLSFGEGLDAKVVSQASDHIVAQVKAGADAPVGMRTLSIGSARLDDAIAVFDKLARVDITPNDSIARIGGNGGLIPKQKAVYRAVGYAAGADGKPGTEDDLKLGYMPASWSLKPFDQVAEEDHDLKYAGKIDARGIFTPGDAGLNPERRMSANNVGNLTVVGTVTEGEQMLSGNAHLMVTVQDYVRSLIQ